LIHAPENSADNRFVQSVTFNGKTYTKNYFNHFDLQKGGTLIIKMSSKPNKQRGTDEADFPYSFSKGNK
jgi:putative alpha-1,2-mannosidase